MNTNYIETTVSRLRVFGNRALRRIFGTKRDEVIGGWRKMHNEELHNLYCSPSIIRIFKSRRMRWEGHVARMGTKKRAYRIFVGNSE
jgi:PAS domain-containing protein